MAHLLEDKLYDDCEFSNRRRNSVENQVAHSERVDGRTRQVVACGVTYRECCELVVVGCLCELCMARLMRDEALRVADYWNGNPHQTRAAKSDNASWRNGDGETTTAQRNWRRGRAAKGCCCRHLFEGHANGGKSAWQRRLMLRLSSGS